jgi:hypothetical protein
VNGRAQRYFERVSGPPAEMHATDRGGARMAADE